VCRRSRRHPERDSIRRKRFASRAGVSLQAKRPGGKAGLRSSEKRCPRFSIGLDPSLVSPQRFDAAPQVLASHARRQLTSRLSRARAVTPVLIANATPPNDSSARPRALGCGLALDGGDSLLKSLGEFGVRQLSQPTLGRPRRFPAPAQPEPSSTRTRCWSAGPPQEEPEFGTTTRDHVTTPRNHRTRQRRGHVCGSRRFWVRGEPTASHPAWCAYRSESKTVEPCYTTSARR